MTFSLMGSLVGSLAGPLMGLPRRAFIFNSAPRPQAHLMRYLCILATLLLAALLAPTAQADAMRCGSKLVNSGDTQSEVRELCGEPTDVQTRTVVRRRYFDRYGRRFNFGEQIEEEVAVEVWTYNLGPYKLQRRVLFIDGLVDEIETLGYGYHERARE